MNTLQDNVLFQSGITALLEHEENTGHREAYLIEKLLELKEIYLEKWGGGSVCREIILAEERTSIKRLRKRLKNLKKGVG